MAEIETGKKGLSVIFHQMADLVCACERGFGA
jgi:hypothetical protein